MIWLENNKVIGVFRLNIREFLREKKLTITDQLLNIHNIGKPHGLNSSYQLTENSEK